MKSLLRSCLRAWHVVVRQPMTVQPNYLLPNQTSCITTTTFHPSIALHSTPSLCLVSVCAKMQQATIARTARQGLRTVSRHTPASRRYLAAPASGSFNYQSGESGGVKIASRDVAGPTSTVAVVARAGTRFQPLPGFSDALEKFAFKVAPCEAQFRHGS